MLENCEATLEQAADKLRHDVSQAGMSVDILAFAQRYSVDPEILDRAALLQYAARELEDSPDEAPDLASQLLDLIEVIVFAYAAGGGERAIRERGEAMARLNDHLRRRAPARETVVIGHGLSKRFERFELRGIDLELRLGEMTGIVGGTAHGKTTLLRLVAGELAPDGGELSYPAFGQGAGVIDWSSVRQQTAFITQELPSWLGSLRDTLCLEAAVHGITGAENRAAVNFIVERLDLREQLDKEWRHLSGGCRLRFSLARALVRKPRLLILDEPLACLDMRAKAALMRDLQELSGSYSHPMAVVMASVDAEAVESACSSILFLRDGRAEYSGKPHAVCSEDKLNVFEVGCELDVEALSDRLNGTGFSVRASMSRTLLETPSVVSAADVLRTLLDRQVRLACFHDISRSARRLFHQAKGSA